MSDIFDGLDSDNHHEVDKITHVSGMFKNWFIDYASFYSQSYKNRMGFYTHP
jgi:hypothetical protein